MAAKELKARIYTIDSGRRPGEAAAAAVVILVGDGEWFLSSGHFGLANRGLV